MTIVPRTNVSPGPVASPAAPDVVARSAAARAIASGDSTGPVFCVAIAGIAATTAATPASATAEAQTVRLTRKLLP